MEGSFDRARFRLAGPVLGAMILFQDIVQVRRGSDRCTRGVSQLPDRAKFIHDQRTSSVFSVYRP